MKRSSFLKRTGVLVLGLVAAPRMLLAQSAKIFTIPGDDGHVRHGLLTRHKRGKNLPSWLKHVQRDRFYANGHSPSERDMISYQFEGKDTQFNVVLAKNEGLIYQGKRKIELKDGVETGKRTEKFEFRITKPGESVEISTQHEAEETLFVLRGNIAVDGMEMSEGQGMTAFTPSKIRNISHVSSVICIARKFKQHV